MRVKWSNNLGNVILLQIGLKLNHYFLPGNNYKCALVGENSKKGIVVCKGKWNLMRNYVAGGLIPMNV